MQPTLSLKDCECLLPVTRQWKLVIRDHEMAAQLKRTLLPKEQNCCNAATD